ncbi:hypothetical protein [Ekhidna sp.]
MKKQLTLLTIILTNITYTYSQERVSENAAIAELKARIDKLEKVKNKRKTIGNEEVFQKFPKVKFDFNRPDKITIPKKIKQGEFYQIEVTGINKNQYRLIVQSSDTVYSTPLSFPTFGTIDLSTLTSLVSSLPVNISSAEDTLEIEKTLEKTALMGFNKGISLKAHFNAINIEMDPLIKNLLNEIERQKAADDIRKLIETKITTVKAHTSKFEVDLKISKEAIENKKYDYATYRILRQTGEDAKKYEPNVKNELEAFAEYRSTLNELKTSVDISTKSFNEFLSEGKIIVFLADPKNLDLKVNVEKAKKALSEASSKTSKVTSMISADKVEQQLKSMINIYPHDSYISLPIQLNGEHANVNIRFIPKDSTSALQPYSLSTIRFPKRKWYWSVGPSIYYANLSNERLGTETITVNDTIQRFTVFKEADLANEIGAAVLLRAGYKIFDSGLGIHASVGTGLSLGDEVLPRMLYGIGFTFGQTHSLSIDIGGISGYVRKVSQNANYSREYVEKPSLIVNDLQTRFFFGVGYAFRF